MSLMMTVANNILAQLGGNKFIAMTGAKNLLGSDEERSLQFRIGRGAKSGINSVRIVLDASDTYTVTFYKIGTARTCYAVTEVASVSGVQADSLRSVFTSHTGYETSLGTLGA